jgi:signal transduction histidine kinase
VTLKAWVTLVACVAQAMLGVLALRAKGPLARPLTAMSACLFAWSFGAFTFEVTGQPAWRLLDVAVSPFTPAVGLHFALAFVGRRRSLRGVLALAYAFFAVLALGSVIGFGWPRFPLAAGAVAWTVLFLVGVVAAGALTLWLLVDYHRRCATSEEGARTRLLLLALPLAAAFGTTDLVHLLTPAVPELSPVGTLSCAVLMTVVTRRLHLFEREPGAGTVVHAAIFGAIAVAAYVLVSRALAAHLAMMVVAIATLTLVLVAVLRELAGVSAARRQRHAQLALLGRFSAQMAHDLKNPLAAMKGATQFLAEEREQGRSLDEHAEFIELIGEQVDRLHRIVDEYERMGRVQPVLRPLDAAALVREVTALQPFAGDGIEVQVLADDSLPVVADRDLLGRALENLLRNAAEAMENGGKLTVRARKTNLPEAAGGVEISVEDSGAGMDARASERAFDDFFTTKPTGSGLGLAFVQRVSDAHGGSVSLSSKVGCGTVVTLRLPSSQREML